MVGLLLYWAARRGLPVGVFEALRTPKRQASLYAQGRTAPGPIVTWTMQSAHLGGRAVDVVWRYSRARGWTWAEPWRGAWEELGALGEECGLEWGGRWRRPDRPHFQV